MVSKKKGENKMKQALILIPEKINGLLTDYADDLEEAWSHLGDNEALNINLSAKIGFDKHSKPACEVTISFIKEKIKGSVTFTWGNQENLFKVVKGIDDSLKKDHTSMTISSSSGKSVTLGDKEAKG
jgi:ribosomal protein L10